jgi:biotin transporter BioY
MRISRRRKTHGKRPGPAQTTGAGLLDARATLVALALLLVLGLAVFPLLKDGRVLDNLGAGLRYWAGANR